MPNNAHIFFLFLTSVVEYSIRSGLMKKIAFVAVVTVLLFSLLSCENAIFDGNLLVSPEADSTAREKVATVKNYLAMPSEIDIGNKDITLKDFLYNTISDLSNKLGLEIPQDDIDDLVTGIIGDNEIPLGVQIKMIPVVGHELVYALLSLNSDKDIAAMGDLLSLSLSSEEKSYEAMSDFFKLLKSIFGNEESSGSLFTLGEAMDIPDGTDGLKIGDFIATQMIVSIVFKAIPEAVARDYASFMGSVQNADVQTYLENFDLFKVLLGGTEVIDQVTYTYTFLNKYNSSITMFDVGKLGSILQGGAQ